MIQFTNVKDTFRGFIIYRAPTFWRADRTASQL